jgi:hypothetical protein
MFFDETGSLTNVIDGFIAQVNFGILPVRHYPHNMKRIDVDGRSRLIPCYLIKGRFHAWVLMKLADSQNMASGPAMSRVYLLFICPNALERT